MSFVVSVKTIRVNDHRDSLERVGLDSIDRVGIDPIKGVTTTHQWVTTNSDARSD
jgi:hypothetical protein